LLDRNKNSLWADERRPNSAKDSKRAGEASGPKPDAGGECLGVYAIESAKRKNHKPVIRGDVTSKQPDSREDCGKK